MRLNGSAIQYAVHASKTQVVEITFVKEQGLIGVASHQWQDLALFFYGFI